MANEGDGLSPTKNEPTKVATDVGALTKHLADIIDSARACSFTLSGTVLQASRGNVHFADQPKLEFQGPDGYRIVGRNTLELVGAACTKAKTGAQDLYVEFPCDAIIR